MLILLILTIGYILWGIFELQAHKRNVNKIPIRIHVNGTRGKSSVTRLIAGGLRASGMRVIAKTTGTKPRFIISNTEEVPIKRLGKPNIGEDKKIFREAVKYKPDAIVLECMALVPEYQWTSAHRIIKSNYGVITNARADHLDVMGPTVFDVAKNLSNTIPKNGKFFTADASHLEIFRHRARKQKTEVFLADPNMVTDEDMKGFSYVEHKENVALAVLVCSHLGIDKNTALKGMYQANPDPGVMRIWTIQDQGKEMRLVNTLAANDPDSIFLLWERVKNLSDERIVLVNCRDDRADRSLQLGELTAQKFDADWFVATGFLTMPYVKKATSLGIPKQKIVNLEGKTPEQIYSKVLDLVKKNALIFATGNIVGFGETVIAYFAQKGGEIDYKSENQ
ncbi:MAG: poly-gamma-glutamate synthase PgsB [candidate division WOR-3 bacterium]|nr:poly-gamma-glutamate synthase PgsB [candidate division WOR-3 bacterium]